MIGLRSFQARVRDWVIACFGPATADDREATCGAFAEEAVELLQASGYSEEAMIATVRRVYRGKPGQPRQEMGGTMTTLAALAGAHRLDMEGDGEAELARIWTKVEQIRAKKPGGTTPG